MGCRYVLQNVARIGQQHDHAFFFRAVLYGKNPFHRDSIHRVAAQAPYRIGGVEYSAAVLQRLHAVFYVVFKVHHSSWSFVISMAHLKWPSGQARCPCKPHGRQ